MNEYYISYFLEHIANVTSQIYSGLKLSFFGNLLIMKENAGNDIFWIVLVFLLFFFTIFLFVNVKKSLNEISTILGPPEGKRTNDYNFFVPFRFNDFLQKIKEKIRENENEINQKENWMRLKQTNVDLISNIISDGLIECDANGNIEKVNMVFEKIMRMPHDKIVGMSIFNLLSFLKINEIRQFAESPTDIEQQLNSYLGDKEWRIKNQDGRLLVLQFSIRSITDPSSNKKKIIVIIKDFTESYQSILNATQISERNHRQKDALARIMSLVSTPLENFEDSVKSFSEITAQALSADRLIIWKFEDHKNEELICRNIFIASEHAHKQGMMLRKKHYPRYFHYFTNHEALFVTNAIDDNRLRDLVGSYLSPLKISTKYDHVIWKNGEIWGIISCEYRNQRTDCYPDERAFLSNVSSVFSQMLINYDTKLSLYNLRNGNELFTRLVKTVPDLIVKTDMSGNIDYVNDSLFSQQHAISVEKIMGQNMISIIDEKDLQKVMSAIKELPVKQPGVIEISLAMTDKKVDCEVNGDVVRNEDNLPIGMVFVIRDITEKKKNNEIIRKERQRLNDIILSTDIGTWEWKVQTGELLVNDRWANMIGYSLEELSPISIKTWEKYLHPEDTKVSHERLLKVFAGQEKYYELECRIKHKDGYWIWILDRGGVSEWSKDGKAITMSGTHLDITDKKQAQLDRIKSEKLEKDILLAEESLHFKQRFLSNMSHEIRTPLTGILGMAEMMNNTNLDKVQKDYIQTIVHSGNTLKNIINDILDYSKIEAGKMELRKNVFSPGQLIENSICLFKAIKSSKVRLTHNISSDVPISVSGDENKITQVVNNLLSNALKFTKEGCVSVTLKKMTEISDKKVLLRFEIEDSGIGIPTEKQHFLFQPFSQIDHHETRKIEGTGLGLSICKELVEMHGGKIGVTSEHGQGATFWFTVLIDKVDSTNFTTQSTNPSANKIEKNLVILLAEDTSVNQKVFKLLLESEGHKVTIVENGEKAIRSFQNGAYDLILMDIQMPVMDGITAVEILKKNYSDLPPVVGLSANAFEGDREHYISKGLDDYLTKPLDKEKFNQMLVRFF